VSLLVVDASVAAKWFLPAKGETLTEEAIGLFRRYALGEIRFVVPDLFWAELGNLLWKSIRNGRCSKASAETALASLGECKLPSVSSLTLLDVAFRIATAFDRTVYDSLYVALALHSKAQLITADERLANSLAAHFPVKWLGAVSKRDV
jgi:predicted nucleic acid-binding protein